MSYLNNVILVLQNSILVNTPISQEMSETSEESNEESCGDISPTTPSELFDITLVIGDKKLYTSRSILSCASPVFRKILSNLKNKLISEIPLPGKNYQSVLEMLLFITPGINKRITGQ